MINNAFKLSVDPEGIGRLVFDLPGEKVNKLSLPILDELEEKIDEAGKDKRIKALAISSGKENVFIAGADLHSFELVFKNPSKGEEIISRGHKVFNKIQDLPFPTIALIEGACLGGGMELALACTYRVVSDHPKTQLGLPEVTLGIMPGWGGTQRMPRLVGLVDGLGLILGGKPVNAIKAWKMKLVDAVFPAPFFKEGADKFIKESLTPKGKAVILERRKRKGLKNALLEKNPIGRGFVYSKAKKDILKRTKGHYKAPLVALKLIENSYPLPVARGLDMEVKAFTDNLTGAFFNAPNLIYLFFINEELKKETFVSEDVKPVSIHSAGVIGAGTMGSGISFLFSNKDIPVRMKDVDEAIIGKGFGVAHSIYSKLVKDRKLKKDDANLKFHQISASKDYSGFKNLNLVIEAATENLDLKLKIFKEIESVVSVDAVIGTNTSSLCVSDMAKAFKNPERFVGMHFFNPANKMPLVEVVASDKTSPRTIRTAVDIARKLGKTPIVVRDCPGFLVNRVFIPGANEIMRMFEAGASKELLEKAMLDFGMPMSPFELADEVGNDVGLKVSKVFEEAYGPRMIVPKILSLMVENKLLGKKVGKGFYIYQGKDKKFNPEIEALRKAANINQEVIPQEEVVSRTFLMMINEAARCLEEKIVSKPGYLDMALVMGIGFPPFRGGLLRYANSLGIDNVVTKLKALEKSQGGRFAPCNLLLEMQKQHKTF